MFKLKRVPKIFQVDRVQTQNEGTDKNIFPSQYFSQSKVGQENLASPFL